MVSLRLWLINLYIWIFWGVFSNACLKTLSEMNVSYIRYAYIVNFFQSISNLGLFMKENHESHTLFIDQLKTVKSCKFVTFFFSFYCVGLLNHIGNTSTVSFVTGLLPLTFSYDIAWNIYAGDTPKSEKTLPNCWHISSHNALFFHFDWNL